MAHGADYCLFSLVAGCADNPFHYRGQILAFDPTTLAVVGRFVSMPSTSYGGGVGRSSSGLAADDSGDVYFATGRSLSVEQALEQVDPTRAVDEATVEAQLGPGCAASSTKACAGVPDSLVHLRPTFASQAGHVTSVDFTTGTSSAGPNSPGVYDFFMPYRAFWHDYEGIDVGSGGPALLPGSGAVLLGGKEGIVYVASSAALGGYGLGRQSLASYLGGVTGTQLGCPDAYQGYSYVANDSSADGVTQELVAAANLACPRPNMDQPAEWPRIDGPPVYADLSSGRSFLYVSPEKDRLLAFERQTASSPPRFAPTPAQSPDPSPPYLDDGGLVQEGAPGGALSLSMDPAGGAVLFASRPQDSAGAHGVLHAYDAVPTDAGALTLVWGDDTSPPYRLSPFVPPGLADSRVFLATASGRVMVYGSGIPVPAGVAALARSADQIVVLTIAADGNLYSIVSDSGATSWHPPTRVSNSGGFQPGGAIAWAWDRGHPYTTLDVFAIDRQGALALVTWSAAGWSSVSTISDPALAPPGAPLATGLQWPDANGNYGVDVFVAGNDRQIHIAWQLPGAAWTGPFAIYPTSPCDPTTQQWCFAPRTVLATARQAGHALDVFAVDEAGQLVLLYLIDGVYGWKGPSGLSAPGFAAPSSGVAAGSQDASTLDVFVIAASSGQLAVNQLIGDGPNWLADPVPLYATPTYPTAATITMTGLGANELGVLAVDGSGQPWLSTPAGQSAWSPNAVGGWTVPTEPGAPIATVSLTSSSGPVGFFFGSTRQGVCGLPLAAAGTPMRLF
jgi:hypothetical protein